MNSILLRYRTNTTILSGLILLCSGIVLLMYFRNAEGALLHQLNGLHNPVTDMLFRKITHLGDAAFYWLIGLTVLGTGRQKTGIQLISGGIFACISTSLLKHFISAPRPLTFYGSNTGYLHFMKGISFEGTDSFPSAHTTYAITLAMVLLGNEPRLLLRILYITAGILVGFSRMYLGNHFPGDVLAGMGLGIICATMSMKIIGSFTKHGEKISNNFHSFRQSKSVTPTSTN